LLLLGHGLQKLVPARYSRPVLRASGPRPPLRPFEQLGIRPGPLAMALAALSEIAGGFAFGAGLLTPSWPS